MNTILLNIKTKLTTLAIVVCCLCMHSCKTTEAAATTEPTEPLLVYRKSPCYGPCPAYEATIYNNGLVLLVPQKYMPVTDTVNFMLSGKELKDLTSDLADLNYLSLQELYRTQWTDMPATHLYFYSSGKKIKHIKHQEGGPENLVQFIKDVHELLWKYVIGEQ